MYLQKKSLSREEKKKVGCTAAKPHNCMRLAPPECYPPPGVYEAEELRVSFSCPTKLSAGKSSSSSQSAQAAAGATDCVKFAYTLDGTPPMLTNTVSKHIHILSSEKEPLVLKGRGVYIIRAVSGKEGFVESRISDFAFRLIGGKNSSKIPTPIPRDENPDLIPPLFAVPLYDRFAAEKSEAKHSLTTSSKALTANRLVSAVGSPSRRNNHSKNGSFITSNTNNNSLQQQQQQNRPPMQIAADSTAISAVREATCMRENGAAVVLQNPSLSTQVVSEMMHEQIRQSLAGAKKPPLPISAITGDTVALVMPNQILRDPNPYYHHQKNKKQQIEDEEDDDDDIDISGISLSLANALAQRSKIENNISLSTTATTTKTIHSAGGGGTLSSVLAAGQLVSEASMRFQQNPMMMNNNNNDSSFVRVGDQNISSISFAENNNNNNLSPASRKKLEIRNAMKFGQATRGPLSSSPSAKTIDAALPRSASALSGKFTKIFSNNNNSSSSTSSQHQEILDSLPPRSVTPALQRMYSQPLDSSAYPTPLTKLLEPVLPAPRRDATIKGELKSNLSVLDVSSNNTSNNNNNNSNSNNSKSTKLAIEEINARKKESRVETSASSLLDFAKIATEIPVGTPLFGATTDIKKMEKLALQESDKIADHSRIQLLWYEAREDALKKKRRYVHKEVDTDATFNELMLTHDPQERAQERDYIKKVTTEVSDSHMALPPVQANDYNCTATSFFPGSDIAQTSAPFLRFYHGITDIAPYLINILRHISYDVVHAKLDSEATKDVYKSGLPQDLNILFQEYKLPASTKIPSHVCKNFLRNGTHPGHLLLAFRNCVWNHFKIAEAPMLMLLQFCALAARPNTYSMGDEWDEVKEYTEHDGEISHTVTTTVPHVAFEMAVSLFRKNLDRMHAEQLLKSKHEKMRQQLEANKPLLGNNSNSNSNSSSVTDPSSSSVVMISAATKKVAEEKKRAILHQISQDFVRENAEKRERIREADALTVLVPWKTADANNNADNNNSKDDQQEETKTSKNTYNNNRRESVIAAVGGAGGGKKDQQAIGNVAKRWQHNTTGTFIQDVYLAQILCELEPKLPRLFKVVKDSSSVNWEFYHRVI